MRHETGESWNIVLLTCRDPAKDFRLPLAEELQALGHNVYYVFLKRRPSVVDMATGCKREFSVAEFLRVMRRLRRSCHPLLFFNSTNLAFPILSRVLRWLCGGLWCLDMHDDLLYGKQGKARTQGLIAQRVLLGGSDVIVHAAPTLKRLFPQSQHLGNASSVTSIDRYNPDFSRVLILASIDQRLDFSLLHDAAKTNPDLAFDIFGHIASDDPLVKKRVDDLTRALPNVHYRGPYVNEDLPTILVSYAVTLAPYLVGSPLTEFIDPLRYYHCLNSGMEVLSTGIPKAHDFGGVLHIVHTADEIGPLVKGIASRCVARRNSGSTAAVHNWENRAKKLMEIVSKAFRPQ